VHEVLAELNFKIDPVEKVEPPISGSSLILKLSGSPVTGPFRLHVGHSPDKFDAVVIKGLQAQADIHKSGKKSGIALPLVWSPSNSKGVEGFKKVFFQPAVIVGIGVGGWLCGHLVRFGTVAFNGPGMGPNLSRMVLRRFLVASL
jgi:hypothetical protein